MERETTRGTRRAREESGRPGGGKGRREDVRGSGIYPASGPLPPGRARVKTPASMGRRVIGMRSIGTTAGTAKSSPKRAAAGESLARLIQQAPRGIPLSQWQAFLDGFSIQCEGWITDIEIVQPDQSSRFAARGLPLDGISLDLDAPTGPAAVIVLGKEPPDHLTHTIAAMCKITLRKKAELEIESGDRSKVIVRCRLP